MRRTHARGAKCALMAISFVDKPGTASTLPRAAAAMAKRAQAAALISADDGVRAAALPAPAKNSVATGPGHSAVTVTPVPRSSSASPSENESTNALVAP